MKTKIRIVSQLCILALVIGAISLAGAIRAADTNVSGESSSLSDKDKTFMKKAAKGGMMEVAMGQVAEQKAQSEDVKSFGKRMVTDHGKANDELKSIASKKGFQLPSKEHIMKWTSDKAYMDAMVKDHEKDLAEFKEAIKRYPRLGTVSIYRCPAAPFPRVLRRTEIWCARLLSSTKVFVQTASTRSSFLTSSPWLSIRTERMSRAFGDNGTVSPRRNSSRAS